MTAKRPSKIAPKDYEGVIEMMGIGANYWARSLTGEEWDALAAERGDVSDLYAVAVVGDGEVDERFGQVVTWTHADLDRAFARVLRILPKGSYVREYALDAVRDGDPATGFVDAGHIDSDLGDVMLQALAFGEVVYG